MINFNGELIAPEDAKISVFNRGFLYGDSVFETIRAVNLKLMFWEDHYFRLMSSMRIMRMEIPLNFSPEFLEEEITELLKVNELSAASARIRFSVYRTEGGKYTPEGNETGFIITAEALPNSFYLLDHDSYEVELFKDHFLNSGLLSTVKTNNRAINILGSIFAKENDYHNCFLLNEKKNVVEALNGNIFLVQGNAIKTPPLSDGCLRGVLRGKLIEIINSIPDFSFSEEAISPFELQKADEIFITNVIIGIQPVTKYRKKEFRSKVAKDLLAKLNAKARLG